MGWAKYYEDNVSIITDRMRMRETTIAAVRGPAVVSKVESIAEKCINNKRVVFRAAVSCEAKDRNERRGLELLFTEVADSKTVRMLRLNGWWWSNVRNAWCNTDTASNRLYAQKVMTQARA